MSCLKLRTSFPGLAQQHLPLLFLSTSFLPFLYFLMFKSPPPFLFRVFTPLSLSVCLSVSLSLSLSLATLLFSMFSSDESLSNFSSTSSSSSYSVFRVGDPTSSFVSLLFSLLPRSYSSFVFTFTFVSSSEIQSLMFSTHAQTHAHRTKSLHKYVNRFM